MKCNQIQPLLDDYHYGELEASQVAEVSMHLRDCGQCRQTLESLKVESRLYDAYAAKADAGLEISPDLWKRTFAKAADSMRPEASSHHAIGRTPWWSAWLPASSWARQAIAAIVLVAVSVTGTLMIVNRSRNQAESAAPQGTALAGRAGDKSVDAALKSIQRAEQEYLKAIHELSAIVEKQKSTLDPRIVAELQINLKMIDDHIAATRQAYYSHPDDAELALHMLAAYSRKVEILQELTSVP